MNPRNVSFNASILESAVPGLQVTALPDRPPTRGLTLGHLAQTDKNVATSDFYTDRKVNVQCIIKTGSRELLDDSLDTLNGILAPKEKTLIVPYGTKFRQYTASLTNTTKSNQAGGYVELDLEFQCSDTMGYDTVTNTLIEPTNNTAATNSYNFDIDGTAEWQYPIYRLTFIAVTGGDSKTVTIGNHDTGQSLSIIRSWSSDDVLTIDTGIGSVQVNGVDTDFSGALPIFQVPSGTLDYSDSLTTRTVEIKMTYQKRYI